MLIHPSTRKVSGGGPGTVGESASRTSLPVLVGTQRSPDLVRCDASGLANVEIDPD